MDSTGIAAATIAILTPYLFQAGEEGGDRGADQEAWLTAATIHQSVRSRFAQESDHYPLETLDRYEKNPDKRKAAMGEVLEEILENDAAFSQRLLSLLRKADEAGAGAVFNVNVSGGQVGEIISIDKLEGDLIIGKTPKSQAGRNEKAVDDEGTSKSYPLLRKNLIRYFSEDELRDLAFDLSLDHEILSGDNKRGFARELIIYCERLGRIPDLVAACRERRPNVERWLEEDNQPSS